MKTNNNGFKFYLILGILIVSGIFSWNSFFNTYRQEDTVDIKAFPRTIKGWTSEELELTEEEYAILETRNAFVREYTSPEGQKVMLYIIYSQTNRKVAHPPEICFTGSGSTAITKYETKLASEDKSVTITANRMIFDQVSQQQVMYYWFKVGDSFTPHYLKQQILIALKTFLGKPASSAMIRLTAVARSSSDIEPADKDIKEFAAVIIPLLPKYLP